MREIRIYQPGEYTCSQMVILSPSASQHVRCVLRMVKGQALTLFCGDDREFHAEIIELNKQAVVVKILSLKTMSRESPCRIHLLQAISKGPRMEWVVQKAVELGVSSITPILSARSVVRLDATRAQKKVQQWQDIAIAAAEQCGRNQLPTIKAICTFEEAIKTWHAGLKLVLDPKQSNSWRSYTFGRQDITLLIGPEGGLNTEEIEQSLINAFKPLSLGPRILRTETAAVAALSILQALCGDL